MSINNLNGLNLYSSPFLNSNVSQSYYGQSQDSLFGNNIFSSNVNNFDTAMFAGLTNSGQNSSSTLLQILLPLLMSLFSGQQNTQQSSINQLFAPVNNSAPANNQNLLSLLMSLFSGQQNTQQSSINQSFAPVNNANVFQNQPVVNNKAANTTIVEKAVADLPRLFADHPEWVSTVENSSLNDKTGVSKLISDALANDTFSGKEVICDQPNYINKDGKLEFGTKRGYFYDENGVITKSISYDKGNNDAIQSIIFYEDGKYARSLTTNKSDGSTAEWLHAGGDEQPSGFNRYGADGKLVHSTKYNLIENNETYHTLSNEYYANEKLKESFEMIKTPDQAITFTALRKFYDEEGNVTHTRLNTHNSDGTFVTTESGKDGNVISKTTGVTTKDGGYSNTTVDKDGNVISKTTEERPDGKFVLTDYDKDGKVTSKITADAKLVQAGKVTYTANADDGSKTTHEINDDGTRITTNYDKDGKVIPETAKTEEKPVPTEAAQADQEPAEEE